MTQIAIDVASGTWVDFDNIRVVELDDDGIDDLAEKTDIEIIELGNTGNVPVVPAKHYAKSESILEWLEEQEFTANEAENRVYDLSAKMAHAHALLAVADAYDKLEGAHA